MIDSKQGNGARLGTARLRDERSLAYAEWGPLEGGRWAADAEDLAIQLGLDRFSVSGWAAGGPLSNVDRAVIRRPEVTRRMATTYVEATRSGGRGFTEDMQTLLQPWGGPLELRA